MALYCAGCGASLSSDARFCSACGKPVTEPSSAAGNFSSGTGWRPVGPWMRPLSGRKVAGVCQAIANQYGWDVTLIRVITVLLAVAAFPIGFIAYLVFWLIVPEQPRPAPTSHLDTVV
jgi:phage shock protein C